MNDVVNPENLNVRRRKCTALLMVRGDLSTAPRPLRMLRFLTEQGYTVDTLGYPGESLPDVRNSFALPPRENDFKGKAKRKLGVIFHRLIQALIPNGRLGDWLNDRRFRLARLKQSLLTQNYSHVIVENLELLPLAFRIKKNAKVIFDAREFYPEQFNDSIAFRIFEKPERRRLCRRYFSKCDCVITVSSGIADAYCRAFGILPKVILSAPFLCKLPPQRQCVSPIRIIHHGVANRNRRIERMVEIAIGLDERFRFDFHLVGHPNYVRELQELVGDSTRVRIRPPIPFEDIIPTLAAYDIGLYCLEPSSINLKHSLPNKFFEFIHAGLAVVVGPSEEMARIITKYQCGIVVEDFAAKTFQLALSSLTPSHVNQLKQRSLEARNELCYESQAVQLSRILGEDPGGARHCKYAG